MTPEFAKMKVAYEGSMVVAEEPMVAYIDDFLSPSECAYVIGLARGQLQRAKVSLDESSITSDGRSGSNCWFKYGEDHEIDIIASRVADRIGIPLAHAEAMQVVFYGESQEYRPHYDAYNLYSPRGKRCCNFGGQRLVTALVYLNDVEAGGSTVFPKLAAEIEAKKGRMAIFHNVLEDKITPHPLSLHAGKSIKSGEKWAFNIWFRARPIAEPQDFDRYFEHDGAKRDSQAVGSANKYGEYLDQQLQSGLRIIANRARPFVEAAASHVDGKISLKSPVCISYWDTFANPEPVERCTNLPMISLVARSTASELANRIRLFEATRKLGIQELAAPTAASVQDARAIADSDGLLWGIRDATGSEVEGVNYLPLNAVASHTLGNTQFLQAEIPGQALMAGRKFVVRFLCLVFRGQLSLFNEAIVTCSDSNLSPVALSSVENSESLRNSARATLSAFKPVLTRLISETVDSSRYGIIAIDIIFTGEGSGLIHNFSNMPNFFLGSGLEDVVTYPFFYSTFDALLDQESSMFIQID